MRTIAALATVTTLCALAACGSGVNEVAATTTYNARFVGPATLSSTVVPGGGTIGSGWSAVPLTATVTMSQLASTVTGTIAVTGFNAAMQDTVLTGGVMGRATPTGLDVTIVQPAGCASRFTGPLTLQPDLSLTGTLVGSDCNAQGQNDLQLTLSLARQ